MYCAKIIAMKGLSLRIQVSYWGQRSTSLGECVEQNRAQKRFPLYSTFIRDLGVNGNAKSLYIVNISSVVIFS